jgi:hypothetical protein
VRQGLVAEARRIYEHILQKDPSDDAVRFKLAELNEAQALEVPRRRAVDVAEEDVAAEQVTELPGSQVADFVADTDSSADPFGMAPETGQPGMATTPLQAANPKVAALQQWLTRIQRHA